MRAVVFRKLAVMAALSAALAAGSAWAKTDGSAFLTAVRDRDGTKATEMLSEPGNTLITTKDLSTGETGLHIVIRRRDELWTKFLLERGARPNEPDRRGVTPLALAVNLGFVEGVEQLIKRGARVDDLNAETGETPLIAAVHKRDMAMIRLLLKNGASLDKTDNSGRSAREYARLMGSSAGVLAEIERAEAERKASPAQDSYGPAL